MKVIGLTGGIGTGKSTVARFLAELGAEIIDADKVGHEVFKAGSEAWQDVVAAFGEDILGPDIEISREKLAAMVFNNPDALCRLNEIMHPLIREAVEGRLLDLRGQGAKVAVVEAPLLIEADWEDMADEVWVTVAPEQTTLERILKRSSLSEEQIKSRIKSQLPQSERIKKADVVIDTDCTLQELQGKIKELWQKISG